MEESSQPDDGLFEELSETGRREVIIDGREKRNGVCAMWQLKRVIRKLMNKLTKILVVSFTKKFA